MKKILNILSVCLGIIFADVVVRYLLMKLNLVDVRPFTSAEANEGYFLDIFKAFAWNTIMIGWAYLIYVVSLSVIFSKFIIGRAKRFFLALIFYLILANLYVVIFEKYSNQLLIEGIVSSIPISLIVAFLLKKQKMHNT